MHVQMRCHPALVRHCHMPTRAAMNLQARSNAVVTALYRPILVPMGLEGGKGSPDGGSGRPRPIDEQATAFMDHHRGIIRWVIGTSGIPYDEREDMEQEVAIRILRRFRSLGPLEPGGQKSYAGLVARNVCYDHLRRRMQRPHTTPVEKVHLPDGGRDPEEELVRLQGHERLHMAIATLTPLQRHVVREVMAGRTMRAIADAIELSNGAVRLLHHRAIKQLRRRLVKR